MSQSEVSSSPQQRRRLYRSRQDRVIAGVCGGLARRLDVDPVLVRVAAVILVFYGGVGLLLYALGWLLLPEESQEDSLLEQAFSGERRPGGNGQGTLALAVLLIVFVVVSGLAMINSSWYAWVLLTLTALGLYALLQRGKQPQGTLQAPSAEPAAADGFTSAAPPSTPGWEHHAVARVPKEPADQASGAVESATESTGESAAESTAESTGETSPAETSRAAVSEQLTWDPEDPWGWRPDVPDPTGRDSTGPDYRTPLPSGTWQSPPGGWDEAAKRPRNLLRTLTFSVALIALGILWGIDGAGASVPASAYFATMLAVAGLGLLVGSWFGRARGLIAVGILAAVLLMATTFVGGNWPFRAGDVIMRPASVAEIPDVHESGVGEIEFDLTGVDFTNESTDLTIHHGVGRVLVELPGEVDVRTTTSIGVGSLDVLGTESGGFGVSNEKTDDGEDGPGGGALRLRIELGTGDVVVTREAA